MSGESYDGLGGVNDRISFGRFVARGGIGDGFSSLSTRIHITAL